ncbi:unnamed protein product [Fraxinus pennsylvanica]|uniref:Fe2OG dioxygenase domain-containing protein n=1 Tax=Fraxinus pennsylvanica TaxID=56036 RepID=A0AAD1ZV60_9LAMI|nr:unnamed protein product [Fraxinus pennsylvanica]
MAPMPVSDIKVGHIDDVQELRKSKSSHVPERFIRDTTERPKFDKDIVSSTNSIPVINHGIDVDLLNSIEKVAMEFFMMPLEEKQKYPMIPGTVQGYGQAFVLSEDQKLDWCNMFALGLEPHYIRNPKLWPTKPSNFSVALQAVRMNYYPACPRPDLVLGLSPHSDGSALTVLQQGKGNSVGLQILKDSSWIPVQPIPDALVINIGDTIEVLTNGRYKSVEHRAVTHQEKDRLTIVTFYAPSYEIELGPIQELVNKNNPCKYRRYNHGEYSKHYVTNKLQGKKTLEFAKIKPDSGSEY